MAQKMVVGPNYFVAFASGQGAVSSDSYFTFASDLDATFLTLFNTVNLHTDEINAVQGPVGILPLDIMQFDDSILRPTAVTSGIIGIDSYFPTIQASPNDNRVDIRAGAALAASDRVNQPTPVTLTATYSGGGDTLERFLAISTQGVPTLETLAGQQVVDLWHFDLDSGSVLSNPTRLANVLFDGDDYDQLRTRRGSAPFFEGIDSIEFVDGGGGVDTLVRTVGDWTADGFVNGQTFQVDGSDSNDGTYTITASVTSTTITVATGEFTAEGPSTGIRITGGHFRYSDFDQFHQRVEQLEDILAGLSPSSLNIIFPFGSEGSPSIVMTTAAISEITTGWFRAAANEWGWSSSGVEQVRFLVGQMKAVDGSEANPFYGFANNSDMGMFRIGSNRLGLVCKATTYIELDENGNFDLPEQARVKMVRSTSQTILDNVPTFVNFTAADAWDIGNLTTDVWHDHTAGSSDDEEATCPTGCDGDYLIIANFIWADPVQLTNYRMEILVAGVTISKIVIDTSLAYSDSLTVEWPLVATDVVKFRVNANQASQPSLDLDECSLSIRKVS